MAAGSSFSAVCDGSSFEIWGVLQGEVTVQDLELGAVRFTLLPAALGEFQITARRSATLLRTYVNER